MDKFRSDIYNPLIDDPGFEMDIISAASVGNFELVSQIVSRGSDINVFNANGWSSLMYACHYGHYSVVKVLIDAGCDVNLADPVYKRTALMLAASNGHTRCIELLATCGRCELDQKDVDGHSAVYFAKAHGHGDNKIISSLLKRPFNDLSSKSALLPFNRIHTDYLTPNRNHSIPQPRCHGNTYSLCPPAPTKRHSQVNGPFLNVPKSPHLNRTYGTNQVFPDTMSWSQPQAMPEPFNFTRTTHGHKKSLPSSLDELLDWIGLDIYKDVFRTNHVDLFAFPVLSDEDFIKLGITLLGHRKKLVMAQLRLAESVEIKTTQEALLADMLLAERERLRQELRLRQEENELFRNCIMEWKVIVSRIMDHVNSHMNAVLVVKGLKPNEVYPSDKSPASLRTA